MCFTKRSLYRAVNGRDVVVAAVQLLQLGPANLAQGWVSYILILIWIVPELNQEFYGLFRTIGEAFFKQFVPSLFTCLSLLSSRLGRSWNIFHDWRKPLMGRGDIMWKGISHWVIARTTWNGNWCWTLTMAMKKQQKELRRTSREWRVSQRKSWESI